MSSTGTHAIGVHAALQRLRPGGWLVSCVQSEEEQTVVSGCQLCLDTTFPAVEVNVEGHFPAFM